MTCPIKVELVKGSVMENVAFIDVNSNAISEGSPDDMPDKDSGLALMIEIPQTGSVLRVALVTSDDDSSIIVWVHFLLQNNVTSARRFHHQMKLQEYPLSKLEAKCHQLLGHPSNDGKQLNILMGQGSCSVAYPMP